MRRAFLFRSINRVLGEQVQVRDAAYMWTRHRWTVPFAVTVFAAIALLAPIAGIDEWPTRTVLGLAGVGVAITASTDYRVVAQVDDGLVLLNASKIRQVATGFVQHLPPDAELVPVGGTVIATDWQVGEHRYTVPRSSEQAMNRMAAARSNGS